ncbi:MAG: hypothetical protein A2Z29_05530 [Chloroflexi bacterium RBG_16_56_11]|nr:MAG: hypothetical protein A2Z29_05530 [Chloroflexi bacterium RBG_16_56_11]
MISATRLDILFAMRNYFPEVAHMKRVIWPVAALIFLAAVTVLSGCDSITSPPSTNNAGSSSQNTGIWVTGEGKVTVTPDLAILNLGVEAQADTVAQAKQGADAAMNAVLEALKNGGVAANDIQTRYFSIEQLTRYDNFTQKQTVTGYRVSNTVTVKIRVLSVESFTLDYKAGRIIESVVNAGGDLIRINSIGFTVDDPVPYQKEAREKALTDARDKARQIADKDGLKLGEPTFISETNSSIPYNLPQYYGLAVPAPMITIGTSISPGETTVIVTIQVAYDIR